MHLNLGTKSVTLFEEVMEDLEGGVWLTKVCHWVGLWDFITSPDFDSLFSLSVENVVSLVSALTPSCQGFLPLWILFGIGR